jgi:hypothetical protein
MKGVVLFLLLLCAGCTFTMTTKWSDSVPTRVEDAKLRQEYDKMMSDIKTFIDELRRAPDDIDAINAVLKKYGIEKQKKGSP